MFDSVGLAGFKSRPMFLYWPRLLALFLSSIVLSFFILVGFVGQGSSD